MKVPRDEHPEFCSFCPIVNYTTVLCARGCGRCKEATIHLLVFLSCAPHSWHPMNSHFNSSPKGPEFAAWILSSSSRTSFSSMDSAEIVLYFRKANWALPLRLHSCLGFLYILKYKTLFWFHNLSNLTTTLPSKAVSLKQPIKNSTTVGHGNTCM